MLFVIQSNFLLGGIPGGQALLGQVEDAPAGRNRGGERRRGIGGGAGRQGELPQGELHGPAVKDFEIKSFALYKGVRPLCKNKFCLFARSLDSPSSRLSFFRACLFLFFPLLPPALAVTTGSVQKNGPQFALNFGKAVYISSRIV